MAAQGRIALAILVIVVLMPSIGNISLFNLLSLCNIICACMFSFMLKNNNNTCVIFFLYIYFLYRLFTIDVLFENTYS